MIDKNGVALKAGDMVRVAGRRVYTIIELEVGKFFLINDAREIIKMVAAEKMEKYEIDTSWIQRLGQFMREYRGEA